MREVGFGFVTAGVVVLLFVAYELVGTNLSEQHSQARLAQEFDAALSQLQARARPAVTPQRTGRPGKAAGGGPGGGGRQRTVVRRAGRAHLPKPGHTPLAKGKLTSPAVVASVELPLPPPGGALDHLVVPAIGLDRYVVQGVDEADLQEGPGHYPGTPLPGERGNVGIAGHRTTFGAPFFRLNELVPGDAIYLTDTSGTTWAYSVERQWVVPPTDVAVLGPSREHELTLTTCNPRFEATSRLVVRALLVGHLGRGSILGRHLPVSIGGLSKASKLAAPKHKAAKATPTTIAPALATTTVPAAVTTVAPHVTVPTQSRREPGTRGGDTPTVGPEGEVLATGGPQTWLAMTGWAALALAAWTAVRVLASRRYRYAKLAVLFTGALVCLVPLWFVFENVVDLLPANL